MPAASARLQLAARHHVGAGAELRQRRDHRLVGIRLDRVADQRRHVGEGARRTRGSAAPASRSNSNRTACRPPRASAGEIHRLGVQHAVAIGEVVHRRQAQSSSTVEREGVFSGPVERSAGLRVELGRCGDGSPPLRPACAIRDRRCSSTSRRAADRARPCGRSRRARKASASAPITARRKTTELPVTAGS